MNKTSLFPPAPGQLHNLFASLEETPLYKQWGEGKESNALANGADDFLCAGLWPVLKKSLPREDVHMGSAFTSASYCPGGKGSDHGEGPL